MRIKTFFLIIIFSLGFLLFSQEATDLVSQGDQMYAERENLSKAKEAMGKYHEALLKATDKYAVYWRLAKTEYFLGVRATSDKEKKAIFEQGIYHAKKAVELAPDKAEGHFWLGVNYGVYGEAKGVLKSLSLVKPIKNEMNKVIELNRELEGGGADRALGRVYFKLPGFVGGSNDKSLEHLLKSKEICSSNALTRIYLADTYQALKKADKAREELEYVINMEPDPRWIPETKELKEEAKKMLQKKEFQKK